MQMFHLNKRSIKLSLLARHLASLCARRACIFRSPSRQLLDCARSVVGLYPGGRFPQRRRQRRICSAYRLPALARTTNFIILLVCVNARQRLPNAIFNVCAPTAVNSSNSVCCHIIDRRPRRVGRRHKLITKVIIPTRHTWMIQHAGH